VVVTAAIDDAVERMAPGGRLERALPLTGGVSAEVFRLDLVSADGDRRRVVFRLLGASGFKGEQKRIASMEYRLLSALRRAGLPVPEPYLLCSGIRDARADAYLLMEWIDGSTQLHAGDLSTGLEQMARFLAELHALPTELLEVPGLGPIEDPVEAVRPYLPDDRTGSQLVESLDALTPGWKESLTRNDAVLVHGDYWPGNVIWVAARLAAVIDWEDAALGDPLADLATARVELLCAYGREAMERFTASYLAARPTVGAGTLHLEALPVWEVYVSAAALASMRKWDLDPAVELRRRLSTQRFLERAARDLRSARR